MKVSPSHFLGGMFFIILGVLMLASSLGYIWLDGELTVSAVFASAGIVMLISYFFFKSGAWALILGCMSLFTGSAIFIERTRIVSEEGIGMILFLLAALIFLSALTGGRKNWWAIIPGGGCLIFAGNILLDMLVWRADHYHGVLFFGGVGVIFGIIYLLKNETYKLDWAKYPGLIGLGFALLILLTVDFRDDFARFVFPAILVLIGLLLISRSARRMKLEVKPDKKAEAEEPVDIPVPDSAEVTPPKRKRRKTG